MKKICLALLFLLPVCVGFSQMARRPNPYKVAIGVGYYLTLKDPYVVDLKFYNKQGYSFEFIGYNLQESWRLTTVFVPYIPMSRDGKLRLLAGPGVHVGFWKDRYKNNSYESNPIVGVDAIVGLEYRIPHTPIDLQIHYQPSFDLAGNQDFHYEFDWSGAVIRFAF